MTRRIITVSALIILMLTSGCATLPTDDERPRRLINLTSEEWAKVFYAAVAIYMVTRWDSGDHDPVYVGTGAPPNDEDRPAYCDAPEHDQLPECS